MSIHSQHGRTTRKTWRLPVDWHLRWRLFVLDGRQRRPARRPEDPRRWHRHPAASWLRRRQGIAMHGAQILRWRGGDCHQNQHRPRQIMAGVVRVESTAAANGHPGSSPTFRACIITAHYFDILLSVLLIWEDSNKLSYWTIITSLPNQVEKSKLICKDIKSCTSLKPLTSCKLSLCWHWFSNKTLNLFPSNVNSYTCSNNTYNRQHT